MSRATDRREGRSWPGYLFGGRVRTSTLALLIAFFATWWLFETYQPAPAPPEQVPATEVVPPGFIPDPAYTWAPRADVLRRSPTPTTTAPATTTPTTTETEAPSTTVSESPGPEPTPGAPSTPGPATPGAPTPGPATPGPSTPFETHSPETPRASTTPVSPSPVTSLPVTTSSAPGATTSATPAPPAR